MIPQIQTENESKLQDKINNKTKPIGALGDLEKIAKQIGCIQNTLSPKITKPTIVVFAGDHGIVKNHPVSPYPQEVTHQMVFNFLNGGAAINVFCKQHHINLKIVDAGVNFDFDKTANIAHHKIAYGTKDYASQTAMNSAEFDKAFASSKNIISNLHREGTNTIGFGEMGIGNTSSASLLMHYFTNLSLDDCVGSGTGLDLDGINTKKEVLQRVFQFHKSQIQSPTDALMAFGGFEIVMICSAILEAARLKMTILIDGFIVTAALLAAVAIDKNVLDYCIFCHTSNENGHQKMLAFLNVSPLLNLNMRLGEGSGVAVAFPLIESAVAFLNEMASFKSANVSEAN